MEDETQGPQDVDTSGDRTGTSTETVTMTQEEVTAMKAKAWSDSRSALGREDLAAATTTDQSVLDTLRETNPDAFAKVVATRDAAKKVEDDKARVANLDERERVVAEKETATKGTEREQAAAKVAEETKVPVGVLLDFGGADEASMRDLAKHVNPATDTTPIHADSARTTGGGEKSLDELTKVDTRGMGMDQLNAHGKALDAAIKAAPR